MLLSKKILLGIAAVFFVVVSTSCHNMKSNVAAVNQAHTDAINAWDSRLNPVHAVISPLDPLSLDNWCRWFGIESADDAAARSATPDPAQSVPNAEDPYPYY